MTDWRPNWKDLSNYPFGQQRSNRWWAWQFARRNARYEAEWESERRENQKVMEDIGRQIGKSLTLAVGTFPGRNWNETWGFTRPLGPDVETPPPNVDFTGTVMAIPGGRVSTQQFLRGRFLLSPELLEDDSRWVGYLDLSRELKGQLKEIGRRAGKEQERLLTKGAIKVRSKKSQSRMWAFYLCLLDADFAGATRPVIARELECDPVRPTKVLDDKLLSTRLVKALSLTEPAGYLWEFFGLR